MFMVVRCYHCQVGLKWKCRGRVHDNSTKEGSRTARTVATRLPVPTGVCGNDPSAGSPTETLLRLLLPLDNKV